MSTYTPAGHGRETVDGVDGGHGIGQQRSVSLVGMEADWRSLRFVTLPPGSSVGPRLLVDSEVIVYVLRGAVTAALPNQRATLQVGGCLALPVGGQLDLANEGDHEAEFVIAELGAG